MTRAKEDLDLISPQRFFVRQQSAQGDRHVYALRSRFIPDQLTTLFESCASPIERAAVDALTACEPGVPVDVAARIRARWSRTG
jgi:DNA helicase-2/ATP-dependent DNA helicase PcrA